MYPQVLINVRLDSNQDVVNLPGVISAVKNAEQELADRGRILLRPSGTEPLIRVMAEGENAELVQQSAETIADAVRHAISR
jgi:phosphoglucosamine mutase